MLTDAHGSASPSVLQAHWLLDEGKWISSEKIHFKLHDVYDSGKIAFTTKWPSPGQGKDAREDAAYIVRFDETKFLYWNRYKIATVDADDQFEHHVDDHGTNLKITIKGSSETRRKHVHLRHGFVADKPWPVGPVTLFNPRPEPIPQAELVATRMEIGLNPDGSVPEGGLSPRKVETGMDRNGESGKTNDHEGESKSIITSPVVWLSSLLGLIIFTTMPIR